MFILLLLKLNRQSWIKQVKLEGLDWKFTTELGMQLGVFLSGSAESQNTELEIENKWRNRRVTSQ